MHLLKSIETLSLDEGYWCNQRIEKRAAYPVAFGFCDTQFVLIPGDIYEEFTPHVVLATCTHCLVEWDKLHQRKMP